MSNNSTYHAQSVSVNGNSAYSAPVFLVPDGMVPAALGVTEHKSVVSSSTNQQLSKPNDVPNAEKLKALMGKLEIGSFYGNKIKQLAGYEIVVVCDDSGSMSWPLTNHTGKTKTRWDELKEIVSRVLEIAVLLDDDGVDLYPLNQDPITKVKSIKDKAVTEFFEKGPGGVTPLGKVLRKILANKKDAVAKGKLLILIATDGVPTDDEGRNDTETVEYILKNERKLKYSDPTSAYVGFLACTDDKQTMEFLKEWDTKMDKLDVVDDFVSERAEVEEAAKKKGEKGYFSYGDYIVKALIGSVDPTLDKADE
jgi:hypothetical protein